MAETVEDLAAELGIPASVLRGYLAAYAEQDEDGRPAVEGDRVTAWAAAEARAHAVTDQDGGEYAGPLIGDTVSVAGEVLELASRGGVLGATVDVGGGAAPVWLPLSQLAVTERRRERP